ncbi:AAA family ATPase [Desulfofundulus sp. TPOSR]|uniref:ParA family protein n=1 Tax=Desulfofundulus sp. TPOSR TaxID=2714340 RepID=UPI00140E6AC8|nr:AAA family ATPase [Desulfofundulus sp. TPOSR]NHM25928.1 AAA family ATPase [Desulfofundulus sp. TPOSR]
MATTISFINFKGGVGKTTLCVEIGASLASKFNERVLLIDLDPQTNATLYLMREKDWKEHCETKGSLYNFFSASLKGEVFDLSQIVVKAPVNHWQLKNFDLLPSSLELFGIDLELATRFGHGDLKPKLFLRDALKDLQSDYDYVLIDCPPNLYLATQNGLFASDGYVIVALAEYLSTVGISYIQRAIGKIFDDANERLGMAGSAARFRVPELVGIIFNRLYSQERGTVAEETTMIRIEMQYGDKVFKTKIPRSTRIAERPGLSQKIPIAVSGYAADRAYEQRMAEVAEEFYDRLTAP